MATSKSITITINSADPDGKVFKYFYDGDNDVNISPTEGTANPECTVTVHSNTVRSIGLMYWNSPATVVFEAAGVDYTVSSGTYGVINVAANTATTITLDMELAADTYTQFDISTISPNSSDYYLSSVSLRASNTTQHYITLPTTESLTSNVTYYITPVILDNNHTTTTTTTTPAPATVNLATDNINDTVSVTVTDNSTGTSEQVDVVIGELSTVHIDMTD